MSLICALLCGFAGVDLILVSARFLMLLYLECEDLSLVDKPDLKKIKEELLPYPGITSTAKKDGLSKGYGGEAVRFFSGTKRMNKYIAAWMEVLCPGEGQSVCDRLLAKCK